MKQTRQMSETIKLGILLALSGGFMDAYSYIQRDQVFANAQTGNMLLFGVNSLLLPGFCFCNRNCHSRACSCQRKRPFTLETGVCFI